MLYLARVWAIWLQTRFDFGLLQSGNEELARGIARSRAQSHVWLRIKPQARHIRSHSRKNRLRFSNSRLQARLRRRGKTKRIRPELSDNFPFSTGRTRSAKQFRSLS